MRLFASLAGCALAVAAATVPGAGSAHAATPLAPLATVDSRHLSQPATALATGDSRHLSQPATALATGDSRHVSQPTVPAACTVSGPDRNAPALPVATSSTALPLPAQLFSADWSRAVSGGDFS